MGANVNKKARTTLPNDYERMIPEYHKGKSIYGEHIARYSAIGAITKNKKVLDIASGSGYGTAIIAKNAAHVTGVDISEESVLYAQEHYGANNITYLTGDGQSIPCDDESFDVIVSFETIEHVKDYKKFLDECRRVLKKDGLFILSTPNDKEFAEGNHFHLHEFELQELRDLLKDYFRYTKEYFQATWIGNTIGSEDDLTKEWHDKTITINVAPIDSSKFLYFYFLCANRSVTEAIDTSTVISEHWSERSLVEEINDRSHRDKLTYDHIHNLESIINEYKAEQEVFKNTTVYRLNEYVIKVKNLMRRDKK